MGIIEKMRLDGKAIYVTGAASGIGKAAATAFAGPGADVAIVDINIEGAEKVAKEIAEATGSKTIAIQCDVTKQDQVEAMVAKVVDTYGKLDACYNNAGIALNVEAENMTYEQWSKVIDINLNGTFFMTQAVCRHMVDKGIKGVVINTSSVASQIVSPNTGAYSASKGGVTMFTKFAALEMAKYGIRVCAFGPGTHATRLTEGTRLNPERCEMFLRNIPMGRFGEPDEATSVALFLGSDEASYCTGQTWIEDGGNTLF